MAALTKSTLPSVVFLLATSIIISGTSRATGQGLADEVVKEIQYLGVDVIYDASNMLRGVARASSSQSSVQVGLNQAGSSVESEPNSRVAPRLASRPNSSSSTMQVTNDDVQEELEKFGVKLINHCGNFFGKFPEAARKLQGGLNQKKNQARQSVSSDQNSEVAGSVSERNKGYNN